MDPFATSHFSDDGLLHNTKLIVAHENRTCAVILTRLAEIEERRLFLREGCPTMHSYCVRELHFSEGVAYKRVEAARTARRYHGVLVALAEGRLHLRAVLMLAPHLTSGNADELVAAATHKTRFELEELLAQRFPRPDLPERLRAVTAVGGPSSMAGPPAPQAVAIGSGSNSLTIPEQPGHADLEVPLPASAFRSVLKGPEVLGPRERVTSLAPERFGLQLTLDRETYDLLEEARALTGHRNPTGEILPVLKGALKCYVAELRKQKYAATTRPRPSRPSTAPRHIPAAVKSAVWERDGGQCTFVSDCGQRCPARSRLEFDHRVPVAHGGQATPENVRLMCRSHNQYAAERAFGAEFMDRKRREKSA